ncbi:MAG: class I SAM-dependent methyltransferase [Oscillospiraceae bacterium]|jgi:tRNA (adenine22-N1)-methyltransferase|nr:class I SAM-dependent methyltransferase [Oscillospiraceae bacterium]
MGRPLSLSPRLLAISSRLPKGLRVADIGTDHARLPVYLLQQGIAAAVIATDVGEGPLKAARVTLKKHGLEDVVQLRLCRGALGLSPQEFDAAVVAGIGGDTIIGILQDSPWLLRKPLFIQPQTKVARAEAWLREQGARVEAAAVYEGRRKYVILSVTGEGLI